jgi:hypothetical protein
MITIEQKTSTINRIQELVGERWPEAVYVGEAGRGESFPVSTPALRSLFPAAGIPSGRSFLRQNECVAATTGGDITTHFGSLY